MEKLHNMGQILIYTVLTFLFCGLFGSSIKIIILQLLSINNMSKEIEMFEISDQNQVVGTEIMDPNLPSNLDFDEKEEHQQEHASINPEKKVAEMGKALVIGNDMKEFRIKGKAMLRPQPHFHIGSPVPLGLQTHPIHLFGQESHGLKKLWESIVGYSKREMLVQDGQVYLMQRRGKGLVVDSVIHLWDLFKVFVDPQEQKIRLVIHSQNRLLNVDIQPANFILVLNMINHQLNAIGISLSD